MKRGQPDPPSHVIAQPGDRVALCGDKGQRGKGGPLPVVWAPYAWRHVVGYGCVLCAGCAGVGVVP